MRIVEKIVYIIEKASHSVEPSCVILIAMYILKKDYLWELMRISEEITSHSYMEVYNCISKIHMKYVPTALIHRNSFIDRVRIHKVNERYYTYKDVSYIHNPGIYKYIKFGRANKEYQPVFYGAINTPEIEMQRAVAYMETSPSSNVQMQSTEFEEVFTVSRWKVIKDIEIAEVIFSEDAYKVSSTVSRALEYQYDKIKHHPYRDYLLDQAVFFSNEYSKIASKEPFDYYTTAAYFNYVCEHTHIKGITYPSVKARYLGQNVALLPNVVDKYLKLEQVAVFDACYSPDGVIVDVREVAYDFGKYNMSFKYAPMRNNIILPDYYSSKRNVA